MEPTRLDLLLIFKASPVIYTILLILSLMSFVTWLYTFLSLKSAALMPPAFLKQLRGLLLERRYDIAYKLCEETPAPGALILSTALLTRKHGHQVMVDSMQTEGKRVGVLLWQRLALLNDVAVIAPMLGLLGTVLGLFYAFYDVNRSADTLASLFDGLGIAVGTTVAGLTVAILSMLFYATLKFRVTRLLNELENTTLSIGNLIET